MRLLTTAILITITSGAALAQTMPPMGGPMSHIMVERIGDALHIHLESSEPMLLQTYGKTYDPPAAVLNGAWFNAQYGWMAEGFWTPPAGAAIWIELLDQTPGLETYRAMTFEPIFTTSASSSRLLWDGRMMHNWYAARSPGDYEATYTVYFGDAVTGEPTPGYQPAEVTLRWVLPCRVDIDGSGDLDFFDFLAFQSLFAAGDMTADFDGDGQLTFFDFLAFQTQFAAGCD